jgi:hypothetical protein
MNLQVLAVFRRPYAKMGFAERRGSYRVIVCRSCEIALPDGTKRCPMCQRNLMFPRLLVIGGILVAFGLLGVFLWGSGKLKNRIDRDQYSSEEVLKATQSLVVQNPAVRNPVGFSTIEQTTVEHWDGRRWRVSGYIDRRPGPGVKVRTLYFAVVLSNGKNWNLEDLQLQSMEFGGGPKSHN